MEPNTFVRVSSTARAARRASVPTAAWNISTPSSVPAHTFLGASIVAPGHKQVLPLPPEFIVPQDGAEKQDCERNAVKRWLAHHGPAVAWLRPIVLGDDLFACQPIAAAVQQAGGNFIFTCKPTSHRTIVEYLQGAELEEHRQTVVTRGKRTTTIYRWLSAVPLRAKPRALHRPRRR